ncbi:C-terminal helicase domain-containing protein, partial [Limnoraphis robusta CCNP1324]|uniref:C-terminal helicase domain-containing protein n=1 Tax=Limnoraphis robusta TaxID=1118279 RepID=UPI002B1F509C
FTHAIENDLPLPIGTQDMGLLDTSANDEDSELWDAADDGEDGDNGDPTQETGGVISEADYRKRAGAIYQRYSNQFRRRFKWLRPALFEDDLRKDLQADAEALMKVLHQAGPWEAKRDAKLSALINLLQGEHPTAKLLLFTQFADTVDYLTGQLEARGVSALAGVTGGSADPTAIAHRFSPISNKKRDRVSPQDELRVVLATDVLSEGQNLQDCAIIVNYDLPWA